MILPLSETADGRIHAMNIGRTRGRPLDLAKPFDEIRNAIERRVSRLQRRREKLDREIKRWSELATSFAS